MAADFADDPMRFESAAPLAPTQRTPAAYVKVEYTGAGVWARFTGTLADGTAITVSGAIVGGPDETDDGVYAVAVRDYRDNPDVVVYIRAGELVELTDDPADHAARAAHALNPVYGPVDRAEFLKWFPRPGAKSKREGVWKWMPPVDHPTPTQMAEFEAMSVPGVQLATVHRGHLPIGGAA